ncbi:hypothetical protein [Aneurinibacillus sp. REN35]|uniref:hypothetical protein n=1 Tax=Aneurinibacillus sp. REN35 TaxID=3237286 RepID=UPI003527697E
MDTKDIDTLVAKITEDLYPEIFPQFQNEAYKFMEEVEQSFGERYTDKEALMNLIAYMSYRSMLTGVKITLTTLKKVDINPYD